MFSFQQQAIILASGSAIRKRLMTSLGLDFMVIPAQCDEQALKDSFQSNDFIELGKQLAVSKALIVSKSYPDHYVIAADQLCLLGNRIFDKPMNHQTAFQHLKELQGQEHQQVASVCIARNQEILWQLEDVTRLTMLPLTDQAIESYLQNEKPYHSCGAYQYETQGKWLFQSVDGAEDTVLGLPLFPLIQALRELGAVSV